MAEADLRLVLRTVADTKGAEQTSAALRRVQRDVARTTLSMRDLAGAVGLATTAQQGLEQAVQFSARLIGGSINAQRENERVTRATAVAYGVNAQQFERFAGALSQQTGFTSKAILEAALSARTLTANYGLTIEQTQELIKASADLARVRGIGVAEAFERVQSAIRGEAEASEYLGLTLNDTFIKNNALNGSVKTTFERMTDGQKAQVRYNELLRQSAVFQGLAASSANSLDGAMLKVEASANKAQLAVGKAAAPTTVLGLRAAANAMELLANNSELVITTLAGLSPILSGVGKFVSDIETSPLARDRAAMRERRDALNSELELQRSILVANDAMRQAQQRLERPSAAGAFATERAAAGRAGERNLQSLRELAYLDQRDAAIRDLLSAQREEVALKEQLTRMEREQGAMAQRRVQYELASIAAQQRALPVQQALQDTERAVERARLVLGIRGTSLEQRQAARATIRGAERNVLPAQRLAAFDVETGVIGAQRAETAFDLSARLTQITIDQAFARQATLIDQAAARVDAQQQVLGQIMQQAIADGFINRPPTQITLQVLGPDGQVTYEELIEAADQAGLPPVIRVSGVRR